MNDSSSDTDSASEKVSSTNFIQHIIKSDLDSGQPSETVHTRFPPEPNGFLHIGHAKSICLNFGIANDFGGICNLRFDDTNPEKESMEYIESIKQSISWLGFDWGDNEYFTSNYFAQLYVFGQELIKQGKAYVCSLNAEQSREYRGNLTEPGKNSPDRDRPKEENLDLFTRMRAGEFGDGEYSLRAKIDMASPNMNMRDPILYRIRHLHHHQTGDSWCIYPMYDFSHCISDAIEGISHSLCSLEFEDHRPLYDWVLNQLDFPAQPQQIEFARLNINYTVMSKRKLKQLVDGGLVEGWDDPRLPTLEGMRRRGYTAKSIRDFCESIGVTRTNSTVDVSMLEFALRSDLDKTSARAMCVLHPVKVVIENFEKDVSETLSMSCHPKDETMGKRSLNFARELYIDRADFAEIPPPKFKRLILGGEVRLRGAYVIKCHEVIKDGQGNIEELRCTYDENTLGKKPEGRKVKGVIHWVEATSALDVEVKLYDRLFSHENPDGAEGDYRDHLNPNSLEVITGCKAEASLANAQVEQRFQFEREGYFCVDKVDSTAEQLVFNLTVGLRDTWSKP